MEDWMNTGGVWIKEDGRRLPKSLKWAISMSLSCLSKLAACEQFKAAPSFSHLSLLASYVAFPLMGTRYHC